MNNPEQIREFFRELADGLVINANGQPLELLHNAHGQPLELLHNVHAWQPIERKENMDPYFIFPTENDFGVGLPPLANQ